MSEDEFQAERQLIHTTMHKAALDVGRALKRIYDGDGWRWHYVSFNSYLEAEFGKRARGYQLKTYAEIVDEALELAAEWQTEPLEPTRVEQRLPAERRLRDLVRRRRPLGHDRRENRQQRDDDERANSRTKSHGFPSNPYLATAKIS